MTKVRTNPSRSIHHWKAERFVRILLVSFAASVVTTRLFLTLTGFPKIGGGELHIAHLLWGGLLLFVATMLLLIFANGRFYVLGAIFGGVGIGLFIDEVGKFITLNNDYFYPLAIPIIYAFFLVTVMIYLRVRRSQSVNEPRAELAQALERIQYELYRQPTPQEHAELVALLQQITTQQAPPDLITLASLLQKFLENNDFGLAPEAPAAWTVFALKLQALEMKFIGRARLKAVLVIGLGILGFLALAEVFQVGYAAMSSSYISPAASALVDSGQIKSAAGLTWFFIQLGLEGVVGLLMLASSLLLAIDREVQGIELGYFSLLLSLTVVNLLVFYFDQFGNIVLTFIQVALLLALIHYRQQYLSRTSTLVHAITPLGL